ncbi:MAG TPA: type VI secretion system-associated protein TagF [Candidatus Binatia bacterium]|nr:type VI secretion system-associated protein TagF [Candidatus Binatia bacterium]
MDALGYYGKLPRFGDFIRKRLSESFVEPWDGWISRCVVDSQRMLGQGWAETYLSSPIWRFAMSPGVCGPSGVLGIFMPSIDSVERCYPFMLAAELPPQMPAVEQALAKDGWYDAVEQLALSALDEDSFDQHAFEEQLAVLGHMLGEPLQLPIIVEDVAGDAFVAQVPDGVSWLDAIRRAFEQERCRDGGKLSLWWTAGSPDVPPTLLLLKSLPSPRMFVAMMTAEWGGRIRPVAAPVAAEDSDDLGEDSGGHRREESGGDAGEDSHQSRRGDRADDAHQAPTNAPAAAAGAGDEEAGPPSARLAPRGQQPEDGSQADDEDAQAHRGSFHSPRPLAEAEQQTAQSEAEHEILVRPKPASDAATASESQANSTDESTDNPGGT